MKFLLLLLLIMVVTPLAEYFLPWWMIAVIPFLLSMAFHLKGGASFLAGFIGIAMFWYIAALMKDIPNDHILSHKMAQLFKVGDYGVFLFATALIGGLVGGMASWAGSQIRTPKMPHRHIN